MKIGIIGTGNVGGNLGKVWAGRGHEVVFGVRDPNSEKTKAALAAAGPSARAASVREAAAGAGVVVLAVPWSAAEEAIVAAGSLKGKILVDCTNPIAGGPSLEIGHTTSAAEEVAGWAEGARVVKAFNSIGAHHFLDPRFGSQNADGFICGDDAEAKSVVAGLAEEVGFGVVDAGPLASARLLEPLAMLWIRLAYVEGLGPDIAFKLLRK